MHDHPSGRGGSSRFAGNLRTVDRHPRPRGDFIETVVWRRAQHRGDVALVVIGEVDLANAEMFRRELLKLVHAARSTAWLDLARLSFFDASGVRALLDAQASAQCSGIDLVIRTPSLPVRRIVALTATNSKLTIVDC